MTITEEPPTTDSPSRRRRPNRAIIAGGAAAVVVVGAVYVAGWTPLMGLRTVKVEGASTLAAEQLVNTSGLVSGTPMMRVDLRAATSRLADLPQVASVDVERAWPRTVVITVTERGAVAMQKSGSGWELLDDNGNPFAMAPTKPKDLPTIERSPDPATNTAMLQVLVGLTPQVRAEVVSVSASSPNAVRLTLRDNDAIVNWGSPELSDFKARVLQVLLQTKAGWYDVSNPNAPTTGDAPPVPKPLPTDVPSPGPTDSPSPTDGASTEVTPEASAAPVGSAAPVTSDGPVASPQPAVSPIGVVQD